MLIYKAFRWVPHIQHITFSNKKSIEKSCFFWDLILVEIVWGFGTPWCQKAWFCEPLGAQRGPKWRPESPKWHQHMSKTVVWQSLVWRLGSNVAFGTLVGTILVDLGSPLAPKSLIFTWFIDPFLGHRFARRPELTRCFIAKIKQKNSKDLGT